MEHFNVNFDPQFVAFILPTSDPWILSYSPYELYIKLKLQLADWKICVHATAFRQKPLRNQVIYLGHMSYVTLRSKDDRGGQNHPGSYWTYSILFVFLSTKKPMKKMIFIIKCYLIVIWSFIISSHLNQRLNSQRRPSDQLGLQISVFKVQYFVKRPLNEIHRTLVQVKQKWHFDRKNTVKIVPVKIKHFILYLHVIVL